MPTPGDPKAAPGVLLAEACRGPILPGYAYGDLLAADALRERAEPWVGLRPAVPAVASVDRLEEAGQLDADAYDIVVRCGDLESVLVDLRAVRRLTHGPSHRLPAGPRVPTAICPGR